MNRRLSCRVMTNSNPGGRIFLSYPHTNNELFFLLITGFIYFRSGNSEIPDELLHKARFLNGSVLFSKNKSTFFRDRNTSFY